MTKAHTITKIVYLNELKLTWYIKIKFNSK